VAKKQQQQPQGLQLDRFGTYKTFIANLHLYTANGFSMPIVWFVVWDMVDYQTGMLHGASIMRLARITGLSENSVRRAFRTLIKLKLLTVVKEGKVPIYRLHHELKKPNEICPK